ncbi:MAG: ChbG/HpnK family deacetylase [Nitrospinota bacterium]
MAAPKLLIVNGDDFGLSPGVNAGTIAARERGILTSASLMARGPAAGEAAAYARRNLSLSVGLHLDLGEWVCREGNWEILYQVAPAGDARAVRAEARRQLDAFRRLTGMEPTHLDSHQHVHRREPARSIFAEMAQELGVPLRGATPGVRYCGDFYGQTAEGHPLPGTLTVDHLLGVLGRLGPGAAELGCHPGQGKDFESPYLHERGRELATLCDPRVRAALPDLGITLCSFRSAELGPLLAGLAVQAGG